jgi:hypothetical protein
VAKELERMTGITAHQTDLTLQTLRSEIPKDMIPALHRLPFGAPLDPGDNLERHFLEHSQATVGGTTGLRGVFA